MVRTGIQNSYLVMRMRDDNGSCIRVWCGDLTWSERSISIMSPYWPEAESRPGRLECLDLRQPRRPQSQR